MNSIQYDSPRIKEMDDFLKYLYTIGIQNPGFSFNKDIIYRLLCKYSLCGDDITDDGELKSNKELFPKWIEWNNEEGNYQQGQRVEHYLSMRHFLQFYSKYGQDEIDNGKYYIKLYIPMKYDNLFLNVKELFNFITEEKIVHASKVADVIRADNVIVRLLPDDYISAKKIIDFVNIHFGKTDSLNKPNPFIRTTNGVGIMIESGISYNAEISELLANYINLCISSNKMPTINDFYEWFKINNHSNEVGSVFSDAMGSSTELIDWRKSEDIITTESTDKEMIFNNCLMATYEKYGIKQVIHALTHLIFLGNYDYFTNGNDGYRKKMKLRVTKEDAIKYIKKTLNSSSIEISDAIIKLYCYKIFSRNLLRILIKSSIVTLTKYDEEQLKYALKYVIKHNDYSGFSRHSTNPEDKTNYREILSQYKSENILDIMTLSVGLSLDDDYQNNLEQIIELFIQKQIIPNIKNEEDKDNRIR